MDTTQETVLHFALEKLDAMIAILAGMDDATANRTLGVPGSNSPYVLLFHSLGAMRRWSSTVNRGIEISRDREAEFTASGSVAELLELAAHHRAAFIADVLATDLAASPAVPAEGFPDVYGRSSLAVLVHVVEELAQHLGHLEITRDVLATLSGTGGPLPSKLFSRPSWRKGNKTS